MNGHNTISSNPLVFTIRQLAYAGFFLIIVFCSVLSHTMLPVPPTMVFFLLGSALLLCISLSTGKIYNPTPLGLPLFSALYFLVSQVIIGAPLSRYSGVVLAICYFLVSASYGNLITQEERKALIRKFLVVSIVMLIAECAWRFTHPNEYFKIYAEMGDPRWIYQYKFGGLMYVDSNAVGIHIVIVLFYILYRQKYFGENYRLMIWILLVLLVLTISRAAWLGVFVGYLYWRFLHGKGAFAYLTGAIAVVFILIAASFFLARAIQNDLSFLSKIDILNATLQYFSKVSINDLIFGVGFSNSEKALGVYAHNFIMVFLIESGVIGLFLVILMFTYFMVISRGRGLIILIPFLITTLSATITFIPYFYMIMALIFLDVKDEQKALREN